MSFIDELGDTLIYGLKASVDAETRNVSADGGRLSSSIDQDGNLVEDGTTRGGLSLTHPVVLGAGLLMVVGVFFLALRK